MFKLAVICGGPSAERGISLNSARSVLDHISPHGVEIVPIYFNQQGEAYHLSPGQLYSNTPSDFDFKLKRESKPLAEDALIALLKKCDLAFPAIHGAFGEDGKLQRLLEKNHIPFTGPTAETCQRMFDKYHAAQEMKTHGFETLPSLLLTKESSHADAVEEFFAAHNLKRVIVKPTSGGSSIDVYSATSPQQVIEIASKIVPHYTNGSMIVEPFCEGVEFTIVVLESMSGKPVALIPTEIETSYEDGAIFDYRKKYLATNQATHHTPPRFSDSDIDLIRDQAEKIFTAFGMRDFVRLDGWRLKDGRILFTDLNPISGMEQNSFLFQQSSRIGMTHAQTLMHVIHSACRRYALTMPSLNEKPKGQQKVHVLFGGDTAERQVSVMSGTNVWLKLRESTAFAPEPFLLDKKGGVWKLPYAAALNHTVEEIIADCEEYQQNAGRTQKWLGKTRSALGLEATKLQAPEHMTFDRFIALCKEQNAFVFLGLHGGGGEGGDLQALLEKNGLTFNGSHEKAARLCMDKYATGQTIETMHDPFISSAKKKLFATSDLLNHAPKDLHDLWDKLVKDLGSAALIVKPQGDGCSAGIVKLSSAEELAIYLDLIRRGAPCIPAGTFLGQSAIIEMPSTRNSNLLFENFIVTDKLSTQGSELVFEKKTGWIELTIGIRESGGTYHALNPSITVAEGHVLSLEEKFQGGTGVNITPPPKEIVPPPLLTETKTRMERVAKTLGIQNYTRIDFFLNVTNGRIIVIEANTLPGLTPSTVIYHQALAETPPQTPREFLEGIIRDAKDGQQPIRIYNEIGIGNQWFICHEREQGEHESRHKGFAKIKIEAVYLRFWIGKKSMVISTNDGITFKRRSRNEFKVLFGYSGQPSDKI